MFLSILHFYQFYVTTDFRLEPILLPILGYYQFQATIDFEKLLINMTKKLVVAFDFCSKF
jgi:hypothetical protein